MPGEEMAPSSTWKNRRDWLTAAIATLGLCVSIGGYLLARGSAKSGKALILVAQKADNIAGSQGLSFVFHPLNANQKISGIDIVFPRSVNFESQSAQPLTQELDLSIAAHLVERYEFNRVHPAEDTTSIWDGSIPIILEAQYVFADEALVHRGLYKLRTRVLWRASGPPLVKFLDVIFDRSLSAGGDDAVVLASSLADEEEAERKRFNPTR